MSGSVRDVIDLLHRSAGAVDSVVDGDEIDILSHSLQCAALLADRAPDDVDLQLAGLVHDIGHVVAPGRQAEHGRVGGDVVRPVLGDRVAALVELHVPAKRYLVATDPDYTGTLSRGSTTSLELQGGPLSAEEQAELEREPHFTDALDLRRADEAAKVIGLSVPGLERWQPVLLEAAVRRHLDRLGVAYEALPCDPDFADTAAFCQRYGVAPEDSANTIVVASKGEPRRHAACVVLATTRLDVNGAVRRRLGARKASFASAEDTNELTGMAIGGVTPLALPADMPLWVDGQVMSRDHVVLGGGSRSLKIRVSPSLFETMSQAEIVPGLATQPG